MIIPIVTIVVIVALAVLVCGMSDSAKARRIRQKYKEKQASRTPVSDEDFCIKANISKAEVDYVSKFRSAFATFGGFDSLKMYPEDDYGDYGIAYDDDMAMFLSDKGLLKDHPNYRYSFPLEEAQDFASLILLTQKINKEIERGDTNPLAKSG